MNQLVGWLLVAVGFVDLILARLVLAPRLPDPRTRSIVTGAVTLGGFFMLVLGGVFLFGLIGL